MSTMHVICGPAGTGKSTYGRQLASSLKACLLDSDTATEPVVRAGMSFGGGDPDDRDSETYRAAFRDPVYDCLLNTASENLPHVDVVLVGPFTTEIRDPTWAESLRKRFGVGVEVVFVTCEDSERRERIVKRGNPRDGLKLADWKGYLAASDSRPPAFKHRVVRT